MMENRKAVPLHLSKGVVRHVARSVLEPLGACLVSIDGRNRILSVFPRVGHGSGFSRDELVGKDFDEAFRGGVSRIGMRSGSIQEVSTVTAADGTRRTFEIRNPSPREECFKTLYPEASSFRIVSELPSRSAGDAASRGTRETDERGLLDRAFRLEALNHRLIRRTKRLRNDLKTLEQRNRRNVKEMNLAVELQKCLLPKSYPDTPNISFTHRYIPLAMVGGDFFHIVKLDEDRVGVLISDVSGHGIAPAFITAMVRSSFDYLYPKMGDPASVMHALNEEFSKIIETDHFITAFYAIFDFSAMTCSYCNAGHPPQIIMRTDGSAIELPPTDPIIGMIDDREFSNAEIAILPGDLLCFFTDGIIEARDAGDRMFGAEGIMRVARASSGMTLDDTANTLLTELIQFMKDPCFDDDITLVLAQITEEL
ncbi:MAG: PP2C family protein-serine/threonine phosphatase [Spirochaetes bacterium]|nr:PP2C family protein-serine/threonine phosphatase [Spirochaetota bacterium]